MTGLRGGPAQLLARWREEGATKEVPEPALKIGLGDRLGWAVDVADMYWGDCMLDGSPEYVMLDLGMSRAACSMYIVLALSIKPPCWKAAMGTIGCTQPAPCLLCISRLLDMAPGCLSLGLCSG